MSDRRAHAETLVILPTYCERGNLEPLVNEILDVSDAIDIVIVDDRSPDGTGALADELARRNQRVSVIHRARKLGLGSAHRAGFAHALATGASHVVTMDADYSHHPRYLTNVIALTEHHDVGIGSRYVEGGGVAPDWGWHRKLLSRTANAVTRLALGFDVRDCTSGFRCYRRRAIEGIDWSEIRSNGYSFLVEALFVARSRGFSFGETPILFENRSRGRSKVGVQEVFRAIATVLRLCGRRASSTARRDQR